VQTSLTQDDLAAVLETAVDRELETMRSESSEPLADADGYVNLTVTVRVKFAPAEDGSEGFSRDDICCICYGPGPGMYGPPYCRGTCC
jgi:hypothetical protein